MNKSDVTATSLVELSRHQEAQPWFSEWVPREQCTGRWGAPTLAVLGGCSRWANTAQLDQRHSGGGRVTLSDSIPTSKHTHTYIR